MWASIQVRLVAFAGEAGFERRAGEHQVAGVMVALVDVAGERDGDFRRRGRNVHDPAVGLELAADRHQRGGDDAEGTADGMPPVPLNSKAPTSRGP